MKKRVAAPRLAKYATVTAMQNGWFRAECMSDDWWNDYSEENDANHAAINHNRGVHNVHRGGTRPKDKDGVT